MLVLVHHAEALPPDIDPMRPLSATGRDTAERLASEAAARGVHPAVIWHSGKLRARQTAEPFRRACNPLAEYAAVRGLQPDDPASWMRDHLAGEERPVLIVGHMPHLARLLCLLLEPSPGAAPSFPPHGLVALELEGDKWKESWRLDGT